MNTNLTPINQMARVVSQLKELDPHDRNTQDAFAIAESLRSSGLLAKNVPIHEVARQVFYLLRKIPEVVNTLSPEVMALEKKKLEIKREELNIKKENKKQNILLSRMKTERVNSLNSHFKRIALDLLSVEDFMTIRDLAEIAEKESHFPKVESFYPDPK